MVELDLARHADSAFATLADASLKVLVLFVLTAVLCLALRRRHPLVRSLVWSAALIGAIVIPLAAQLLPPLPVPGLPPLVASTPADAADPSPSDPLVPPSSARHVREPGPPEVTVPAAARGRGRVMSSDIGWVAAQRWTVWALLVWLVGLVVALAWHVVGMVSVHALARRARSVASGEWSATASRTARSLGIARPVAVLFSDEVQVPVTWGTRRPRILLPTHAETWCAGRREVVVLHEMVHVARADWLFRLLARLVCVAYWFNPLAWLALRRLAVEQELACDREVLARGARPSTYATHLLAIARGSSPRFAPLTAALGESRRGRLEERIMTILDPKQLHAAGRNVVLPVLVLMVGLIPALAAVQTWSDPTSSSEAGSPVYNPELRAVVREMVELEQEMQPELDRLEGIEAEMQPVLAELESVDEGAEPFHERMQAIEQELAPYQELMAAVEEEMAPYHEQMAAIEDEMRPFLEQIEEVALELEPLHGELEEIRFGEEGMESLDAVIEELHRRLEPLHLRLEEMHLELAPFQERMEAIHERLEPFHQRMEAVHEEMAEHLEKMEAIHVDMEPIHERIEAIQERLEPFHKRMQAIHEQLEPFHRKMEQLHGRLLAGLQLEVKGIIERELGDMLDASAPVDEAASRVVESLSLETNDERLRVRASRREVAEILADLLAPHSTATTELQLQAAIGRAAETIAAFEIEAATD